MTSFHSLGEVASSSPSSETKLGNALVDLARLEKLRSVRLWYFLAGKYSCYAEQLRVASNGRIAVDFTASTAS